MILANVQGKTFTMEGIATELESETARIAGLHSWIRQISYSITKEQVSSSGSSDDFRMVFNHDPVDALIGDLQTPVSSGSSNTSTEWCLADPPHSLPTEPVPSRNLEKCSDLGIQFQEERDGIVSSSALHNE